MEFDSCFINLRRPSPLHLCLSRLLEQTLPLKGLANSCSKCCYFDVALHCSYGSRLFNTVSSIPRRTTFSSVWFHVKSIHFSSVMSFQSVDQCCISHLYYSTSCGLSFPSDQTSRLTIFYRLYPSMKFSFSKPVFRPRLASISMMLQMKAPDVGGRLGRTNVLTVDLQRELKPREDWQAL